MALLSIGQPGWKPREASTLTKILEGVKIAEGILGTALEVPKFVQDYRLSQEKLKTAPLDRAKTLAEIGQVTDEARPGEPGAFEVGNGMWRKFAPSIDREYRQLQVNALRRDSRLPTPEETEQYFSMVPESKRGIWTKEAIAATPVGDLERRIGPWGTESATSERQLTEEKYLIERTTEPYVEGAPIPLGYRKKDFSYLGLKTRLVPDKVNEAYVARQIANVSREEKRYDEALKNVRDLAKPFVVGGRGAIQANQLGQQIMNVQKAERIIDQILAKKLVPNEPIALELGTDLIRILSGGTTGGTEAERTALLPHTAEISIRKGIQYVEGKPVAILNKEFLNQYKHQFDTLRDSLYGFYDAKTQGAAILLRPEFKRYPDLEELFWKAVAAGSVRNTLNTSSAVGPTKSQVDLFPAKGP